jgi:hypothetical protein
MRINEVYGIGGWCKNCDEAHDHPLNNIIEMVEVPDEETSEGAE